MFDEILWKPMPASPSLLEESHKIFHMPSSTHLSHIGMNQVVPTLCHCAVKL